MRNFNEIEERLFKIFDVSRAKEMATIMKVSQSTYGNWKQRNKIPYSEIITICEKYEKNLNFILTGKEEKQLNINEIRENKSIDEIINKTLDIEYISERFNITIDDFNDWKINKPELIRVIELGLFKEKELNIDEDLEKEKMNNILVELVPIIRELQKDVKMLKNIKNQNSN